MPEVILTREDSLCEILRRPKDRLGDLFYHVFLEQYPEVQEYFEKFDLRVQATMLMNALQVIVSHASHRHPATAEYLKILGHRHFQRRIPVDMYPKFTLSMLSALEQFHGDSWSQHLAGLWREAFDLAITAMLAGYVEGPLYY